MFKRASVIFLIVSMLLVLTGADFNRCADCLISIQKMPNDQLFSTQKNLRQINATEAWDITTGDEIIVALIDTGVLIDHEDLSGKIWSNTKEIPNNHRDDDGNGYVDDAFGYNFLKNNGDISDDNGHGTNVASIIGAKTNNLKGVAAINWNTKIMALKALNDLGGGEYGHVAKAIRYAVDNGAKIINMSFGTYLDSDILKQAVDYAISKKVIVVAAAGNNGQRKVLYPAAYSNVISVGAVDSSNQKASFSNFGEDLDVMAPGLNIPVASNSNYNTYINGSGTSYAAAQVSGLASLILSIDYSLIPREVKAIIKNSAVSQNNSLEYGEGIIDMEAALKSIAKIESLSANIYTTATSLLANGIDSAKITATIKNNDQPISSRMIDAYITGDKVMIDGALVESNKDFNLGSTNAQGQISFSISSSLAGNKNILFIDHLSGNHLDNLKLVFIKLQPSTYQAVVINKSPKVNLELGETYTLWVELKNTGTVSWFGLDSKSNNQFKLGTANPLDRNSNLYHSSWISNNRAAAVSQSLVNPGETAKISFTIKANKLGSWSEHFSPVIEYKQWLPIDIVWDVEVTKEGLDTNASHYQAYLVEQSNNLKLSPGQTKIINATFKNTGQAVWLNSNLSDFGNVKLGTYKLADRTSKFYYKNWLGKNRVIESGLSIKYDGQLILGFTVQAPSQPGIYYESFRLVAEHITWFGPVATWRIEVV